MLISGARKMAQNRVYCNVYEPKEYVAYLESLFDGFKNEINKDIKIVSALDAVRYTTYNESEISIFLNTLLNIFVDKYQKYFGLAPRDEVYNHAKTIIRRRIEVL
jgi:hypothetical protein